MVSVLESKFAMPYNRLVVRVGLPIGFNLHRWKNRGDTPYSDSRPRFGFSPSVYINYEASAKSTFRGTANSTMIMEEFWICSPLR